VTLAAIRWLDLHGHEGAFFVFAHYFDIHGPYRPPAPLDRQFIRPGPGRVIPERAIPKYQKLSDPEGRPVNNIDAYMGRYDGEVRYVDRQIERLIHHLKKSGLLEKTLIVIFSDHGETLDERFHVLDHGSRLTEEQIAIPLLIRFPDKAFTGSLGDALAESIDIMPTVLDYLDLPIPETLEGVSLRPLIEGGERGPRRFTFSEAKCKAYRYADRPYRLQSDRVISAVRDDRWKLVELPGSDGPYYELYDLLSDPDERVNLFDMRPAGAGELKKALLDFKSKSKYPDAVFKPVLDKDVWRQLKSLGYVD